MDRLTSSVNDGPARYEGPQVGSSSSLPFLSMPPLNPFQSLSKTKVSRFLSTLPLLQLSEGERKANRLRRRFPPLPLLSGVRSGAGEDGERGLRRPVYIAFVSPSAMSLDWGWVVPVFFHSVKESTLVFPGGACLVEVAPPIGNNLLRPALHLAGACSSAGGGLARFEHVGAGDLVGAPEFVGGCTGALIRLMAASAEEMMTALCSVCRGDGFRDVVVRYVDLVLFWRVQFQDQGGAGCVPGRCSSTEIWFLPVVVGVCCGSCQSHGATPDPR